MELGKITLIGDRDGAGNVSTYMNAQPSNLAEQNIRAFDADQNAEAAALRKRMLEAASDYFSYVNRPNAEVREESKNIKPGVNAMREVAGDRPRASPKRAKKPPKEKKGE